MKQNTEAKKAPAHSPLPWKAMYQKLKDANGRDVVAVGDDGACSDPECCGGASYHLEVSSDDLALIVRAVNGLPAFEAMFSLLTEIAGYAEPQVKAQCEAVLSLARQSRGV